MGFFKKGYTKVSESKISASGSSVVSMGSSNIVNMNGLRIEQCGNKLKINGILIDLDDVQGSFSKEEDVTESKASPEFFKPGEHYLNNFSITVDDDGKLLSISATGGTDVVVNGNVSNVTSSGSGDVQIIGNVGNLVKSGSGDVYKQN